MVDSITRRHRQVPVKVNAYVDVGISELVAALNNIDGISTFESCEGKQGRLAYVLADFGGESRKFTEAEFLAMAVFVFRLVNSYAKHSAGDIEGADISIRWTGSRGYKTPEILIEMPHINIGSVTEVFTNVQAEFVCDSKNKRESDCQESL